MTLSEQLTPRDEGFIMLCSHLGDPKRPVLTPKMMSSLQKLVAQARIEDPDAMLTVRSLEQMGAKPDLAQRVGYLMSARDQMRRYVDDGWYRGCYPITIASAYYPWMLKARLGYEGPCCLWAKGPPDALMTAGISVVGSREINDLEESFTRIAACNIAKAGYTLVSGNANGTDKKAQFAATCEKGPVISVVAEQLNAMGCDPVWLYLSENDYDVRFSAARALSRNRVIHAMSCATLVSACTEGRGGTWSGSTQNLKNRWSPLGCFDEGRDNHALIRLGAMPLGNRDVCDVPKMLGRLQAFWKNNGPCVP